MANASLDPIKTRLNETDPYHPGSANTFYDWSMEAGDVVTMKRGEEEYDIPVFSSRTLWKGTPQIVVNSTGNKEHEAIANASKDKYRRGSSAMRNENYIYHEFTSSDGMLYSAIYMSESKLQTVFSDAIESVNSTIIQTASEIYSAVYSGDSSVYSYVLQTATQIYSHVGDVESGLHSEINQTAEEIYSSVYAADSQIYSYVRQTASQIYSHVGNVESDLHSEINQTAEEIYSSVYAADSAVYSYVNQTATQIYSHVGNVESGLHSEINQTADQIYSSVYAADSALYSYVNQTASGIRQEVGNVQSGLQSSINQQANRISLVVEGTGSNASIKAAKIVEAINDDGTSQTLISANKILLDGNTTIYGVLGIEDGGLKVKGNAFFNGDITMASGKEILAGAIRSTGVRFPGSNPGADRTLTLDDVTGMIVKAEVSSDGKTLKLWKKGDASSSPSITFEKAAPVNSLTGNWSGSTLTINTDPSIQGVDYTIGFGGQYGADDTELQIASNSLPTVVSSVALSVPVTVQSLNSTGSPTERYTTAVTANIANLLQARTGNNKITMNGPYTPDPGYIGFSSVEVDVSGSSTIDGLTGNWSNNVLSVKTDPDAGYTYTVGFGGQYGDHNTEFSVVGNGLPTVASATSLNFPVKVQSLNPSGSPTDRYTTSITAAVSTLLQTKSATSNNTYTPDQGYIGLSSVQVAVPLKVSGGWSGNTNTFTAQYSASGENSVSITPRVHPITGTAENATIKIGELNNGSWTDHGGDTNLYLVLSGKTVYLNSRNSASGSWLLTYAQKDVSSVYDAGHDDGITDSGTATARVGETEDWTFTIESADETSTNLTIDVSDIYDDARQGYVPTSTGKEAATYNTSTSDQVISAGQYLKGDQTIKAVKTSNTLVASNIRHSINVTVGDDNNAGRIKNLTGTFTSASTVSSGQTAATVSQILQGYSAWVNGAEVKGAILGKSATTYNTSTSDQTIASGLYLSGTQTIKAVTTANIDAANIKYGVNVKVGDSNSATRIKDVTGTFTAMDTVSEGQTAASASQIVSGYSAWVQGAEVKGSMSSKAAATYNVSTSDQSIASGQYLSGAQTIRAVTTSGIEEANIKSGTVIKVGDAGSDTRIITKTGTFTDASTVSSGQTAATADKILPGYSAWVDGVEVKGTSAAIYTQEEYDDYGAARFAAGCTNITIGAWTDTYSSNSTKRYTVMSGSGTSAVLAMSFTVKATGNGYTKELLFNSNNGMGSNRALTMAYRDGYTAGYSAGGGGSSPSYSVGFNSTGTFGSGTKPGDALKGWSPQQITGVPNSQNQTYRYIKFTVDGKQRSFYFS